ncbi:glycoside hydrolase family 27 protein [Sphaerobolus stellatus SS14]|nr:glycoside hydrolase family 27 protein [Sphaerobolus stellatus SS14]
MPVLGARFALLSALLCFIPAVTSQSGAWGQCGGTGWAGATTCITGYTCTYSNPYYSQCLPGASTSPSSSSSSSSSTSSSTTTNGASPLPTTATGHLPALGWNSWNAYGGNINETIILAAAQDIVSLGLKAAGYQYVNIDTWSNISGRDPATQRIKPDSNKFPNGIASLATQIHNLGLKIGIYSDAGTNTCAGYPGSLYYETIDAQTFGEWGIDYLKYDNCNVPSNWTDTYSSDPNYDWYNSNSALRYRRMTAALDSISTPIQYDICNWGNANVWTWGARVAHSWRMTGDSSATWSFISSAIANNAQYLDYVQFGGHNDMDMMEIGNGNLTIQEQRTHFAAWVFMKSPILLGTDLSLLSTTQLAIVTNAELLAFHQDSTVGAAAKPFGTATTSPPEFYAGNSTKGTHVFIINTGSASASKTVTFSQVPGLKAGSFKVHDMWASADLGTFSNSYSVTLASHDTAALLITPA